MILIKNTENTDGSNTMTITLNGNAEEVVQEYIALTLKLHEEYPMVLDCAQWYLWYLDDILELRKEVLKNDKTDKHND